MVNPKETAWHLCDYLPTILDVCWVWEGNITTDTLLWAVNNYLLTLSAPAIWSLCQDKVGSFMMTIIFVSSWQWDGFIVISVHSNIYNHCSHLSHYDRFIVMYSQYKTKTIPHEIIMKSIWKKHFIHQCPLAPVCFKAHSGTTSKLTASMDVECLNMVPNHLVPSWYPMSEPAWYLRNRSSFSELSPWSSNQFGSFTHTFRTETSRLSLPIPQPSSSGERSVKGEWTKSGMEDLWCVLSMWNLSRFTTKNKPGLA